MAKQQVPLCSQCVYFIPGRWTEAHHKTWQTWHSEACHKAKVSVRRTYRDEWAVAEKPAEKNRMNRCKDFEPLNDITG